MRRLLIRPGAIGDVIVSLPALECLRGDFTEIWAPERMLPLLRFADRTASIASTGLDLLEIPGAGCPERLLERLRSFDNIVSWYGANRPEFRRAVCDYNLPFHFFPALPPQGAPCHATDFYLRQASELGAGPCGDGVPRISVPWCEGGYLVIHPFSGSPRKNWPLDRFRQVATALGRYGEVRWCADPEEPLEGAVRFDRLDRLAEWLGGARLFLGNDSGIAHLAAAVGTPVVALFGPSDPNVWAPRASRVRVVATATAGDDIASMPVEAVLQAVEEELGSEGE